ncbi:hypothetical protein KM043_010481 [Ampulex compressa]|nr:hypothetical protein KM043_010481 [Ampulex compressa]
MGGIVTGWLFAIKAQDSDLAKDVSGTRDVATRARARSPLPLFPLPSSPLPLASPEPPAGHLLHCCPLVGPYLRIPGQGGGGRPLPLRRRDRAGGRAMLVHPGENGASLEDAEVLRRRTIFAVYARIFRALLARWMPMSGRSMEDRWDEELEELILPSNEDWRHRVYYGLVELQREWDAELASKRRRSAASEDGSAARDSRGWGWGWSCVRGREGESAAEAEAVAGGEGEGEGASWAPRAAASARDEKGGDPSTAVYSSHGSMTEACVRPGWRLKDILLAGKVLQRISPSPEYADEAEMRRVFGLVYDVLRYNNVLNRALEDAGFWSRNAPLKDRERIVWLLLYDMQGRKFGRRGDAAAMEARERTFQAAGLKDIENALLEAKTRLAASVSRLRIGGSALYLDELLPSHLRNVEGVTWDHRDALASGWVNAAKVSGKEEFVEEMTKLGFASRCKREGTELRELEYVFDSLCPKIVNLHDKARERLAVSPLVRDHRFVFLERSLCLGAAALARAIRVGRLCGPVVLTHSLAPRHTGYLAGLLADIEDVGRLLAFGTGSRRCEYEAYLKRLGITLQRCRVFSEKYTAAASSAELERATVVLAIPPCSYTGVKDIVDLAVARGGDTDLLESLTGTASNSGEADAYRSRALLADQLSTLKHALTRPNVQFLIYEAHTVLPAETTDMIRQVVDYANRMAMEKHLREQRARRKGPSAESGERNAKVGKPSKSAQERPKGRCSGQAGGGCEEDEHSGPTSAEISVPDSDLFEIGSIDDVYGEKVANLLNPGCFLAVIRRKEMMQFDSLFMIKVAESKGLFGDPEQQAKPKAERVVSPPRPTSRVASKPTKRTKRIEVDRLMVPTYSSMLRTLGGRQVCCPRRRGESAKRRKRMGGPSEAGQGVKPEGHRCWGDRCDVCNASRSSPGDARTGRILYPYRAKKLVLPMGSETPANRTTYHAPDLPVPSDHPRGRSLSIFSRHSPRRSRCAFNNNGNLRAPESLFCDSLDEEISKKADLSESARDRALALFPQTPPRSDKYVPGCSDVLWLKRTRSGGVYNFSRGYWEKRGASSTAIGNLALARACRRGPSQEAGLEEIGARIPREFVATSHRRRPRWTSRIHHPGGPIDYKYDLYRLEKGPAGRAVLNEQEATYALKTMHYIRRMENKAAELYRSRLINGFLHLYAGQEAVAVGMKMSLKDTDTLITAYRCHGFAVIFGVPARKILAELMGRKTGVARGKGGSMHMYAPRFYGGDGIVGGQVPIGAGLAFAHKYNGTGAVSFALYGDGAASQGQIFEAWNMSKLWNLPAVYICENNQYGMGTATHRHSANTKFYARGDLIPGIKVDGMKVADVREALKFAREYALRNGPIVIEMVTYRYFGHSMSDPGVGYRTREEIKAVQTEQDPIALFGKLVVENGLMTEEELQKVRDATYKEVDEELELAKADVWPDMSDIATHVYGRPLEKNRGKVPWETH